MVLNNMYVVNYIFYLRKKNRFIDIKIKVIIFIPLKSISLKSNRLKV